MVNIDFSKYSKEELEEIIQRAQGRINFNELKKAYALWKNVLEVVTKFQEETGIDLFLQENNRQFPVYFLPNTPGGLMVKY